MRWPTSSAASRRTPAGENFIAALADSTRPSAAFARERDPVRHRRRRRDEVRRPPRHGVPRPAGHPASRARRASGVRQRTRHRSDRSAVARRRRDRALGGRTGTVHAPRRARRGRRRPGRARPTAPARAAGQHVPACRAGGRPRALRRRAGGAAPASWSPLMAREARQDRWPKPTPRCPRRSTSPASTPARRAQLDRLDGAAARPLGTVAVIGPVELPARHPARRRAGRAGCGQRRRPQAGAPDPRRRLRRRGRLPCDAGIPPDALLCVPLPRRAGRLAPHRAIPTSAGVVLTGSFETAELFARLAPGTAADGRDVGEERPGGHARGRPRPGRRRPGPLRLRPRRAEVLGRVAGHPGGRRRRRPAASAASWSTPCAPSSSARRPTRPPPWGRWSSRRRQAGAGPDHARGPPALAARAAPRRWTTRAVVAGHHRRACARTTGSHRTECFGPVLGLLAARDLDEATRRAERTCPSG